MTTPHNKAKARLMELKRGQRRHFFDGKAYTTSEWVSLWDDLDTILDTILDQYATDMIKEAEARENQLKKGSEILLDAVSCMSIEQFVLWRDDRKAQAITKLRPTTDE